MPKMPERIIYLTELVLPYFKDGKLVDSAPQHIVDGVNEIKEWADMQDQ